jgi:threonylcarbamoyladenosine tRNA methylthiotransferase MtaB
VDEVKFRAAMGYREVVLTGTQVGAYRPSLEVLLRRILDETDVVRLRLSSLQPQDLTPGLVALWADRRLCRHLHLPLQSGSDPVLGRMRRRYSAADYESATAMVREAIPDIAITTDIMVGFPEESDGEFEESYHFCRRIGFARIHVFPYSERPGTAAVGIPRKVGERVKKERSERMLRLAQEAAWRFREQFLGRTMIVLWERKVEEGVWSGLSDNYIKVFARSGGGLKNRLAGAKLVGCCKEGLRGELEREHG